MSSGKPISNKNDMFSFVAPAVVDVPVSVPVPVVVPLVAA